MASVYYGPNFLLKYLIKKRQTLYPRNVHYMVGLERIFGDIDARP